MNARRSEGIDLHVQKCGALSSPESMRSLESLQLNTTHWRAMDLARSFTVSVFPGPKQSGEVSQRNTAHATIGGGGTQVGSVCPNGVEGLELLQANSSRMAGTSTCKQGVCRQAHCKHFSYRALAALQALLGKQKETS
eukprot:1160450-Pelagomonas_calceolata.AAC.2